MFIPLRTARFPWAEVRLRFEEARRKTGSPSLGSTMWGIAFAPKGCRSTGRSTCTRYATPWRRKRCSTRKAVPIGTAFPVPTIGLRTSYGPWRPSRPRDAPEAVRMLALFGEPSLDGIPHGKSRRRSWTSDDERGGAVAGCRAGRDVNGVRCRVFAGNWWAGLLTWVAFAVVITATVTFARSASPSEGGPLPLFPSMKSGACRTGSRNSRGVSTR